MLGKMGIYYVLDTYTYEQRKEETTVSNNHRPPKPPSCDNKHKQVSYTGRLV
jgi:hypothetical protein